MTKSGFMGWFGLIVSSVTLNVACDLFTPELDDALSCVDCAETRGAKTPQQTSSAAVRIAVRICCLARSPRVLMGWTHIFGDSLRIAWKSPFLPQSYNG